MTETDRSALSIEGLSVKVGKTTLLGPVDLELTAGEHVLVVGPSGCGKTTLLRAVAGFAIPATGTIRIDGDVVASARELVVPPERRPVGMLFQGGALWPHMTAAKTLRFTLKHAGQPASRDRVRELLAAVRLEDKAKRRPAELSGGEKQRLALARALATRPRMLLLDEPLGPLDAELRGELLETLAQLHEREGWTLLHVTHDPDEARGHATRLVSLREGRIVGEERLGAPAASSAGPTPNAPVHSEPNATDPGGPLS